MRYLVWSAPRPRAGRDHGADWRPPETVAALESGRIAAGLLGTPAYRLALQSGMHVAYNLAERGVAWPQGGSVTTRGNISANPERIRSYVKAYTEALHLLRTDRDASVSAIAKYAELPDRDVAVQSWEDYRPYYALPPYPDRAALEMVIREELIPNSPRASEVPPEGVLRRPLRPRARRERLHPHPHGPLAPTAPQCSGTAGPRAALWMCHCPVEPEVTERR